MPRKGNLAVFEGKQKRAITPKRKRPRPPKLVSMHFASTSTCMNFLSRFFFILFFDLCTIRLSVSQCEDAPWLAAVLQPGSLFIPEGNQKVHIYNWKEKKVYHILDTGINIIVVNIVILYYYCIR